MITAISGEAAFQILQEKPVNLVVLKMPEPDGFSILQALRVKHPKLKILVISAFVSGGVLKASELVGATASLNKADAPKQLVASVRRLIG